jgi:myo-inositol-1-phosphate synthase
MPKKIRVAIAGIGNCASALIQGCYYYSNNNNNNNSVGLTAYNLGGFEPRDIEFVAAFDVVESKVGKDLSEAIFAKPNNTVRPGGYGSSTNNNNSNSNSDNGKINYDSKKDKDNDDNNNNNNNNNKKNDSRNKNNTIIIKKMDVKVQKAEVLDGIGRHYNEKVKISDKPSADIAKTLKDTQAEILINYLPVGSRRATQYYAERCLDAGVCFINAIPVFIASTPKWQQAFYSRGLACAGDDVMSQLGATVVHKTLVKLLVDRGVKIDNTYQLNVGGDMDFYNMLDEERLEDKRISKTSAVAAMAPYEIPMRIGPSDFVGFLDNDKICYISMRGRYFGNTPVELDLKLRVVDAYNSAGVMIDAIRGVKLAIDRDVHGPLESISAYCFKHPPVQMSYLEAKKQFLEFVEGKRER